ncbi:MAG TPA: conjugal transfer protein TrbE [Caulobacteraceae bacterium]|nr:conjugal transfer protein TrbE [Caulobacteraceae bacterium]
MLYLKEYRPKATRLFDHLPWAALIGPGLILNKDGGFQKTLAFRGPDLASSTDAGLVAARAQLNNALRRLGSRWCVHIEALRAGSQDYPTSAFPEPVSALIDDERRGSFEAEERHFESRYFMTFTHLPPEEAISTAESLLLENAPAGRGAEGMYRAALGGFLATVRQIADILAAIMPEVRELTDDETLTYLHGCISTKRHYVRTPDTPAYLDAFLCDDDFQGGLFPRLGGQYMRTISVRAFPTASSPGLLDRLNELGVAYRWTCRFMPLDKEDARKLVSTVRKRWFAKRKGVMALIKEAITREPSMLEDPDAAAKTQDADAALAILGGDYASIGYFTPTVTLMDADPDRLADRVREVESAINRVGFVCKVEDVNAVEAWLGSLPGQAYADLRRPLVSSLNLCDMIPMSAIWPGPSRNSHLTAECAKRGHAGSQPPLMVAHTAGATPFRLDLHQGDVGHAMVVGPTGAGKSVLLNTLALQWLRYPEAQVFFFDKGASSRASALLSGGQFFVLGGDQTDLAFQPLADLEGPEDRTWAQEWVQDLVAAEGVELTPAVKEEIWSGLRNLAAGPREQRTLTLLAATIQDQAVKSALQPYTLSGPHGHLLDAQDNSRVAARWQTFEMSELMAAKAALQPVLTYIFRTLEARFDGRPTLLVLDEAWLFLDQGTFAAKIREWLKTLRKFNVAVVFATQSLADIARSAIAPALIESCPTRIFLPNPDAATPHIAALYEGFGLNDQQLRIITSATPKRDYYYQSAAGNRLFELGLGPIALAAVGASSPGDHKRIDLALAGDEPFAAAFYRGQSLPEVADYLARLRVGRAA